MNKYADIPVLFIVIMYTSKQQKEFFLCSGAIAVAGVTLHCVYGLRGFGIFMISAVVGGCI